MSATIGSVCVCAAPVVWREWVRIKRAAWFLVTISTVHRRRCNRRTHGDTHQHMDADIMEKRRVWFINLPLVVFITDSVCVSVCVKCAHLYVIVNELKEEVWPGSVWEESDTLWPSATYFSLAVLRLHLSYLSLMSLFFCIWLYFKRLYSFLTLLVSSAVALFHSGFFTPTETAHGQILFHQLEANPKKCLERTRAASKRTKSLPVKCWLYGSCFPWEEKSSLNIFLLQLQKDWLKSWKFWKYWLYFLEK